MKQSIGSCGIIAPERDGLQYRSSRGSELKRFVLLNEVNTPSGRMRPPCRAETVVTSVILYKTERGREGRRARVNCRKQDEIESGGEGEAAEGNIGGGRSR